ncbi:bidirectional sugar transporter SWEET14-like [Phragmites australis]|uniref:bidirectional sugar transporter SWEET14-like n=1 Tax=Phragmites australis TaxID=29695 RepID=UPI002D791130|nr:bidirectional sugar transporter SWEET14-like [Phragmites australis]
MAGLSLQHPWAFAFGLLGNIISFMTYLAPLPTFYRIYKNKSTQSFQSVPYVVALFSAMLWIYYALLKSDECLLITINSAGCVIETLYIAVYLAYAPKKAKLFTAKVLLLLNVGVFGLILLLTLLLTAGKKRVVLLGWVCVAFSVSVFVAPLSIIRQVVRTRSVEFMPFSLSLSLTVSAIVWFLYGLLIKDKYVALPNVLGFTFGVIQMGLYAIYRNATPRVPAKEVADDKEASVADVVKAHEHVVTIVKLGAPSVELKSCDEVHPVRSPPTGEVKQENDAAAAKEEQSNKMTEKLGSNAEQV